MDTIRLRTLAWKSILGFGKYHDLSVQEIYNLHNTRYLRWCYFNCSMISFNDEILEKLKIYDDYKIDKPGKDPELHEKLNSLIKSYMKREYILGASQKKKVMRKIRKAKVDSYSFKVQTKNTLKNKNQGH